MPVSFLVYIDYDDNGQHTPDEAIQHQIIAMRWRLGLPGPYENMAQVGEAQITVRNLTRAFSPEVTPFLPGKRIFIYSDDGITTRRHFTGRITHVDPLPGTWDESIATIHCRDLMHDIAQNEVRVPPLINTRANEAIAAVLARCDLRYPVLAGHIVLGRPNGKVGNLLFGAPYTPAFQAGKSRFAYVGDTWGEGIAADEAIQQLATSERGRFYIDREGRAVFLNRHHMLLQTMPQASFANNMDGMAYTYGEEILSEIDVSVVPRTVSTTASLLWSLAQPQRLPRKGTRRIIARYRDANENPLGALSLANITFTARATPTGGQDLTPFVNVVVIEAGISAAVLEVSNTSEQEAYLHTLTLSGMAVATADRLTLQHRNRYNLTVYGKQALYLNLPTLTDIGEADQIARYEMVRRQTPRGSVRHIDLNARFHNPQALDRTLFHRIRVSDEQTGHTGDYFIVAEEHHVERGGYRHRVQWLLEPADDDRFFIIGRHKLNGTRYPMY
ncbi:hypothetical protein G4Y79_05695 [Phototrophicus methaneseepsis]|uniref:Uncharacterized protein n=1 Tax=Phototrophicus methaneseepsis TaxID=2710758 RepID=A0A7S8EBE7_9CHLR|nr:hypothetical protein [Phototrophicus methaneseepsis]QPC83872.1 hypothetical protein G4Y79_05695 [Phototrophicus methaneseepsis]